MMVAGLSVSFSAFPLLWLPSSSLSSTSSSGLLGNFLFLCVMVLVEIALELIKAPFHVLHNLVSGCLFYLRTSSTWRKRSTPAAPRAGKKKASWQQRQLVRFGGRESSLETKTSKWANIKATSPADVLYYKLIFGLPEIQKYLTRRATRKSFGLGSVRSFRFGPGFGFTQSVPSPKLISGFKLWRMFLW